jgi:hypothetical protein
MRNRICFAMLSLQRVRSGCTCFIRHTIQSLRWDAFAGGAVRAPGIPLPQRLPRLRTWHTPDSHGQILALALRQTSFKHIKLFPFRWAARRHSCADQISIRRWCRAGTWHTASSAASLSGPRSSPTSAVRAPPHIFMCKCVCIRVYLCVYLYIYYINIYIHVYHMNMPIHVFI